MAANQWTTLPVAPLTQPMDTRSRPADLAPGALRYKLNMAVNRSGKISRRAGFSALDFGLRSDSEANPVNNWDHHRRGGAREPIIFEQQITDQSGQTFLYDGTETKLSVMDNATSEWTDILAGVGAANARWQADSLQDKAYFTNNVDPPKVTVIGSGSATDVPFTGLASDSKPTKAKVVLEFSGVIVWMNLEEDGTRYANKIRWSNYRDGEAYATGGADDVSGFQFLDDGEEILNAKEGFGVVWIFTNQKIWRMFTNVTDDSIFGWQRWYSDPDNRNACLAYDNALAFTGKEFYWAGRRTIFTMNQYSSSPSSPDWLLGASGLMFEGDERIDSRFCNSPIAWFIPDEAGNAREIWFSYPRIGGDDGLNDFSLALSFNTDSVKSPFQTSDYVDAGFSAACSFSKKDETTGVCALEPVVVVASSEDWCLKSLGGVFHRSIVSLIDSDPENDIPDASYTITEQGYFSEMFGLMPFGFPSREKICRGVLIEHDTLDDLDAPNKIALRIGNSFHLADPIATGNKCRVQWHNIGELDLKCPDEATESVMASEGTRPDAATEWTNLAEQSRFLYYHLKITGPNGEAPVFGDTAWSSLSFDHLVLP